MSVTTSRSLSSVTVAALMAMVVLAVTKPSQAITCAEVDSCVAPCLPYLTGQGDPPAQCCGGVQTLKEKIPATADRQAACRCLKAVATGIRGLITQAAADLPKKCGVDIGVPITEDIDCDTVK